MISRRSGSFGIWERAIGVASFCLAVAACWLSAVPTIAATSQQLGGVVLEDVHPRVITPNGDSRNDKVFFQFDTTVAGLPIEADVRDILGARVAGLKMNDTEDALTWDGRDDSGNRMPSGIYIYSIKIGQSHATGTVVVAR